jgi:hypothetical protein
MSGLTKATKNVIDVAGLSVALATDTTPGGISQLKPIWSVITTTITLAVNTNYFANTSASPFTVTLPASAVLGDQIKVCDVAGSFNTNNLTIARNGHEINNLAEDLVVDIKNITITLVYSGSTYGWIIQ